jgi:hypothetical protein
MGLNDHKSNSTTDGEQKRPAVESCNDSQVQKKVKESICFMTRLEEQSDDAISFSFNPPLLSDDLDDERVWRDNEIDHSCGFVVVCSDGIDLSDSDLAERIKRKVLLGRECECERDGKNNFNMDAMRTGVYDFLCLSSDTLGQVIDAVAKFKNDNNKGSTRKLFGEADLRWWNMNPDRSGYYRRVAFFRRLARPLCIKVVQADGESFVARGSNFSLLDLLLDLPEIQEYVIDAILLQICCMSNVHRKSSKEEAFMQQLTDSVSKIIDAGRVVDMGACQDVARFVAEMRPRVEDVLPEVPRSIDDDYEANDIARMPDKHRTEIWNQYLTRLEGRGIPTKQQRNVLDSKSGDPESQENRRKFNEERQRMIAEHKMQTLVKYSDDASIRKSNRRIIPMGREADGSLLLTDLDMSLSDFIGKLNFMNNVNESFPRLCNPGESRPRCQQLQLSTDKVSALRKLFFDADGSLSDAIRIDIDTSAKHGYINFQNSMCREERQDKRWQVPMQKHGIGALVSTRKEAENILSGIFNPETEALYDLGILIGGTEDQALHHDVARQVVSWLPERRLVSDEPGMDPVNGWEIDRLAYNEAMSSSNAPSSVLIGMGDARHVLLGVQKDQIIRVGGSFCRIKGGPDNQCFEIVRENEFLVVVKAKTGVMFTGDFPHAGVRNVKVDSKEEELLKALNKRIANVLEKYPDYDRLAQTKAIVDVLCRFPNLDQLCRLHCSTEITTGNLSIPANTIGFCECLANPRDPRCLESDKPVEPEDEDHDYTIVTPVVSPRVDSDDEEELESDDEEEWEDTEPDSLPTLCSFDKYDRRAVQRVRVRYKYVR